jgi:integrase
MPSKRTKYGRGYYWKSSAGTWRTELNRGCEKHRATLPTVEDAKDWIDRVTLDIQRGTAPLDAADQHMVRVALAKLPEGVSLLEVVDHYLRTSPRATVDPIDLTTAVDRFLEARRRANLRPTTIKAYRLVLKRLSKTHGNVQIADITPLNLTDWIDSLELTASSRAFFRRHLRAFWNWAQSAGYTHIDATAGIHSVRVDLPPPSVLTPMQTQKLLKKSTELAPELTLYFALGAFAGIRPHEIRRLTTEDIQPQYIYVGKTKTKTRDARYVDIEPNLRAWIDAYLPAWRHLSTATHRRRFRDIIAAAKLTPWGRDTLRHAYASHHLARGKDAASTAYQLGHIDPKMLYKHYRNIVTAEDGIAYFQILP